MSRHRLGRIALLLLPCLSFAAGASLDQLGIEVRAGSRPFVYTNKEDATFYAETHQHNRVSWQGFNVRGHEFLDDYDLVVNGTILDRSKASRVIVFPDHLARYYPGNIIEELWPVDSLPIIGIHLRSPRPVAAGVIAYFTDGRRLSDYTIRLQSGVALVARNAHPVRTPAADYPVWLAIGSRRAIPETLCTVAGRQFSPIRISGQLARSHMFAIAVANTADQAESLVRTYPDRATQFMAQRRARMQGVLDNAAIETSHPRFDKGFRWALLSLDALVMHQTGRGVFAGLPWFNNYWGRDTFIALPGAALVTERFTLAREILESFAAFQQRDSLSTDYGRIPNIITVTDTAFNTADGTPRFVVVARDYAMRSGDENFLLRIYPVILRSIEGTIKFHTDSLGFLTHADAETWMDAVGPDGPWSPRGNRANDVQALWAGQLDAGIWSATRIGDVISARRWTAVLDLLKKNFLRHFISTAGVVADRIRPDGSPDFRTRPNQLFTAPLLDPPTRAAMVRTVTTQLTYPYGVGSLAQTDSFFHPFHDYPAAYPKDAAYHNGTVWTWLQGTLISELCRYGLADSAFALSLNAVHQILDRGAIGTQSELLDAHARPGEPEPRLSGTVSQAWNLAEFIRNVYDDYLGVRIDRATRRMRLFPHVPAAMGFLSTSFRIDGKTLRVTASEHGDTSAVVINSPSLDRPLAVDLTLADGRGREFSTSFVLQSAAEIRARLADTLLSFASSDPGSMSPRTSRRVGPAREEIGPVAFVTPRPTDGLAVLGKPAYPLLTLGNIMRTNVSAHGLVDAQDPAGDDTGVSADGRTLHYVYPANANFVPGSFDITKFSASYDDSLLYIVLKFTALSDPGWHPEYGFQLTFAAIAIDTDGVTGSGQRAIPANAQFVLPPDRAFERLVLVGGGIRLEDQHGTILTAYTPVPEDAEHPFGDAGTGVIRFALPLRLIGAPGPRWKFTVLAGAQDDHGGAGIGEFRSVNTQRGEWNGGGRMRDNDANVFDMLCTP